MSDLIPTYSYDSSTGELIIHPGSQAVTSAGGADDVNTTIVADDPMSPLKAIDKRAKFLQSRLDEATFNQATGEKVSTLLGRQREAVQGELTHLLTVSRPFQESRSADIERRAAAAQQEQQARLQRELEIRDEVERRAADKALELAASKRAEQVARNLKI